MRQLHLEAGTNVLVGRPANPIPKRRVSEISALLADLDEIREAHLPQVYAVGQIEDARQLLFLVVEPESAIPEVMQQLVPRLEALQSQDFLDVWPVGKTHRLIDTVREADCVVGWRD